MVDEKKLEKQLAAIDKKLSAIAKDVKGIKDKMHIVRKREWKEQKGPIPGSVGGD